MNGSDHLRPQPWLGRVVAEANSIQDDFDLAVTSLPEYLAGLHRGRPRRVDRRAAVRLPVQRAHGGRLEPGRRQAGGGPGRALARAAGRAPVGAVRAAPTGGPAPFLDVAWTLLIRNSAHDSICACSADEVVDAVLHRYAEARQIGDGLTEQALGAVGGSMADGRAGRGQPDRPASGPAWSR